MPMFHIFYGFCNAVIACTAVITGWSDLVGRESIAFLYLGAGIAL
jgi:hypothetical protein